ncbi:speckle-type POZ protein-like [Paramacrobiotus metropolitanus]|uniref:speckle-type POZ protein-like n=1 Tax=Paramacrobiotus metropolitanus TaxID=2943436 RepID=UPI002445750E|nr:speckle-type POZ protein-like [Paramacrobiotus metropolitanus]
MINVIVEIKSETFRVCTMQPDPNVYRHQFCQRQAGILAKVDQHTTDFVIRSSDGQEFPVHRWLLMAHSPVFVAMLSRNTKENQCALCELDDIDGESAAILRDYICGCETGKVNPENAKVIVIMADKYAIADLRLFCELMLARNVTPENATRYLAEQRELTTLKEEGALSAQIAHQGITRRMRDRKLARTVTG